jgi:hypothetical protein
MDAGFLLGLTLTGSDLVQCCWTRMLRTLIGRRAISSDVPYPTDLGIAHVKTTVELVVHEAYMSAIL